MAFTKFASVEFSDILDTKGSDRQVKSASLARLSEFNDYRTEDGYLYARIRAISSRVNKNHDGWPSIELAGSPDIFDRYKQAGADGGFTVEAKKGDEYGFSTFLGKPIFVDHNNSDPSRARGVIVDAKLHVEDHKTAAQLDSYYASAPENHNPPTWIELLLEVDAKSFPKLAKAIIAGSKNSSNGIDGFSMGCDVDYTVCNICKNSAYSPDDFCQHVRMKGADFDHYDNDGKRTSKKSYEDCYGIKFFEISAVFDPADETALIREVKSSVKESKPIFPPCPACGEVAGFKNYPFANGYLECENSACRHLITFQDLGDIMNNLSLNNSLDMMTLPEVDKDHPANARGGKVASTKIADNPLPQAEMEKAPTKVNTLRKEEICGVCGSTMEDEKCSVCNNVDPPHGMNNPDLTKAMDRQNGVESEEIQEQPQEEQPSIPQPLASVNSDMAWTVKVDSHLAGEINTGEQPILNPGGLGTNEPVDETIVSDQTKPVTSSVLTAKDFIAAIGRKQAGENMERVADEVSKDNASASTPDASVDVNGVGSVYEGTNEQSAKADAQTSIDAKGIHPSWNDNPAQRMDVQQQGGNIESTPTQTFPNKNQQNPVSNQPFPASDEGVKKSHDDSAFPKNDGGLAGGSAASGTSPSDPMGNAKDRVDVLDHVTSPSNNSGPTDTWSGTNGNGVTKQQPAVTKEAWPPSDEGVKKSTHMFSAFKLADLEVDLGLTDAERKYARIAELEAESPEVVKASLRYAERVKLAGLSKHAKVAKRLPAMGRAASTEKSSNETESLDLDSALFS